MIGPKVPINDLAIKRLQHNHPTGTTQQDQKHNQAGNEEEVYQPQVQQHEIQVQQNQHASEFQRRMEAHAMRVTKWITEVSPTLYVEPLRFALILKDFYNQQEDHMSAQSLRARFTSS